MVPLFRPHEGSCVAGCDFVVEPVFAHVLGFVFFAYICFEAVAVDIELQKHLDMSLASIVFLQQCRF